MRVLFKCKNIYICVCVCVRTCVRVRVCVCVRVRLFVCRLNQSMQEIRIYRREQMKDICTSTRLIQKNKKEVYIHSFTIILILYNNMFHIFTQRNSKKLYLIYTFSNDSSSYIQELGRDLNYSSNTVSGFYYIPHLSISLYATSFILTKGVQLML